MFVDVGHRAATAPAGTTRSRLTRDRHDDRRLVVVLVVVGLFDQAEILAHLPHCASHVSPFVRSGLTDCDITGADAPRGSNGRHAGVSRRIEWPVSKSSLMPAEMTVAAGCLRRTLSLMAAEPVETPPRVLAQRRDGHDSVQPQAGDPATGRPSPGIARCHAGSAETGVAEVHLHQAAQLPARRARLPATAPRPSLAVDALDHVRVTRDGVRLVGLQAADEVQRGTGPASSASFRPASGWRFSPMSVTPSSTKRSTSEAG